ncbi:mitochondrial inner membrane protease subunit 1 isoform X2 [Phyllostomus discolor]|uniref:Mitochondrial inner membrane protease subunit n=1 Tax=Phyllostomus discolor TaxID=89673 RepID=A0A7E6E134_9CHIR|nr:mitochondrial inner membrane protease subunit 1 isoform X2 [Phyllostomus discolor]
MLRGILGKTFRLVGYTIQYGCIAHCAFEYVGGVVMCSGPSMEPTIQNSDIVFAENLSRHFHGIQRGDIVIAKSPSDPKSNICKRVIGLEGDKMLTKSPSEFFKSHSYTVAIKTCATRPFLGNGSPGNQSQHTANVLIAADVEEVCLLLC